MLSQKTHDCLVDFLEFPQHFLTCPFNFLNSPREAKKPARMRRSLARSFPSTLLLSGRRHFSCLSFRHAPTPPLSLPAMSLRPARTHAQAPGPTRPMTMSQPPKAAAALFNRSRRDTLALRCRSSQSNSVVVVVGREAEASPATQPVPVRLALPIASAVAPHHAQNCQHRHRG